MKDREHTEHCLRVVPVLDIRRDPKELEQWEAGKEDVGQLYSRNCQAPRSLSPTSSPPGNLLMIDCPDNSRALAMKLTLVNSTGDFGNAIFASYTFC